MKPRDSNNPSPYEERVREQSKHLTWTSLTRKQKRWLKEYVSNGFDAKNAALFVYNCNEKSAGHIGYENTIKLERFLEIDPDLDVKLTNEWITAKILKEAEKAKTSRDRLRALELLGKTRAMFKDHQVNETVERKEETTESLTKEFQELIKSVN